MTALQFDEILNITRVSDDSCDESSESPLAKGREHSENAVDYYKIYSELACETSSNSDGEIADENGAATGHDNAAKSATSFKANACREEFQSNYYNINSVSTASQSAESSLQASGAVNRVKNDREAHERSNASLKDAKPTCTCKVSHAPLLKSIENACGEMFEAVRFGVNTQIEKRSNKHKLLLVNSQNSQTESCETESDDNYIGNCADVEGNSPVDDFQFNFYKILALQQRTDEATNDASDNHIRLRHDTSNMLDKYKLFEDKIMVVDESKVCFLDNAKKNVTPSCIAASTSYLALGTTLGSILIADISEYNTERVFNPGNESGAQAASQDAATNVLNWTELDCEAGVCVTCLDVTLQSNYICAGYSNGMVKLLHYNKNLKSAKTNETLDEEETATSANSSVGFGLMAGAVSTAFENFKRGQTYLIVGSRVFDDAILFCKFTHCDSQDEMICCNRNGVAVLTYAKSVLSHSLNVNMLQALNDRLKNVDEIVSIVSCASNPQCKFIANKFVAGLLGIFTLKYCIILSTRPTLSIVFRVSLDKLLHKGSHNATETMMPPSATWMVINNGKCIQTLLVIAVGNQLRFLLLDVRFGQNSLAAQVNCTNFGRMEFSCMIRSLRIVTRDILALIDFENNMHIVQVNLLNQKSMHYDVIRTLKLDNDALDVNAVSLPCTITVHSWNVNMMAHGCKKFAALVTELFQNKKQASAFELKTLSVFSISNEGIFNIELFPWIKVIGETSLKKQFAESMAIVQALSEDAIPSLYGHKAVKAHASSIIVYILHQASAHAIRLTRLLDSNFAVSAEDNLLEFDESSRVHDKEQHDQLRRDVFGKLNDLCRYMVGVCVVMGLYNPLFDLVYRCFNSVKLDAIFARHMLLYIYNNAINLKQIRAPIYDAILDVYDNVLSACCNDLTSLQDQILLLHECTRSCHLNMKLYTATASRFKDLGRDVSCKNDHIVVYNIIANEMCSIQRFCFRNHVEVDAKAAARLTRHGLWHALAYCSSVVSDDYNAVFDIYVTEAVAQLQSFNSGHNALQSDKENDTLFLLPCDISEAMFINRVLYCFLHQILTFGHAADPLKHHCNLLAKLSEEEGTRVTFPLVYDGYQYFVDAADTASNASFDVESLDLLQSSAVAGDVPFPSFMYKILCSSPRLCLVSLLNMFLNFNHVYTRENLVLGDKRHCFNLVLGRLFRCLGHMDKLQHFGPYTNVVYKQIQAMVYTLLLSTYVYNEDIHLEPSVLYTCMHRLLFLMEALDGESIDHQYIDEIPPSAHREIMSINGYFNVDAYHAYFSKRCQTLRDYIEQMRINANTSQDLVWAALVRQMRWIFTNSASRDSWTSSAQFDEIRSFCSKVTNLALSSPLRFNMLELLGDFDEILSTYDHYNRKVPLFEYLKDGVNVIKEANVLDCDAIDGNSVLPFLLVDAEVQRKYSMAILDGLSRLIVLDLERTTDLLVSIFSLERTFVTGAMEMASQHIIKNALKDFPHLQLKVLDALINRRSISSDPFLAACFSNYLELLCAHNPASIVNFLASQDSLDIGTSLMICKGYNAHDAIVYLLIRAGNFQEAVEWILAAIASLSDDFAVTTLVRMAHDLCKEHGEFLSTAMVERLWFGILELLMSRGLKDGSDDAKFDLVAQTFHYGILKFIDPNRALVQLLKYRKAPLRVFLEPLCSLLIEMDFNVFMVTHSTSLSVKVLSTKFDHALSCNRMGVAVSAMDVGDARPGAQGQQTAGGGKAQSNGKGKGTTSGSSAGAGGKTDAARPPTTTSTTTSTSTSTAVCKSKFTSSPNLSQFENAIGCLVNMQLGAGDAAAAGAGTGIGVGATGEASDAQGSRSVLQIPNLYQDVLSTFINGKSSKGGNASVATMNLQSRYIQAIKKGMRRSLQHDPTISIHSCGHVDYSCSDNHECPRCNLN